MHGLGHGAWCWEQWQEAAEVGYTSYAVSLRGHGGSGGRLRTSRLRRYGDDVLAAAMALPAPPVLVGHSMGGLVVQQVLARYTVRAAVLVAPMLAHPAVSSLVAIGRSHPPRRAADRGRGIPAAAPRVAVHELDEADAAAYSARCGGESRLVQYQLLLHGPAGPAPGSPPVLVPATPDDRLVPVTGVRRTAACYGADVVEFPGMGLDLMLDKRWREPLDGMLDWLPKVLTAD